VSGASNGIKSPVYLWNNTQNISGQPPNIPVQSGSANVTAGTNFVTSGTQPATMQVAETAATANGVQLAYTSYSYPHPLVYASSGGGSSSGTPIAPSATVDALFSAVFATRSSDLSGSPSYQWSDGVTIQGYWPGKSAIMLMHFEARPNAPSMIKL
jgi:hypothetical protein